MTDAGDHLLVYEWADIDTAPPEVSARERVLTATLLTDGYRYVVWVPEWLLAEKDDLAPVETADQLLVGEVEDYSDRAYRVWQPDRLDEQTGREPNDYLPKSQVIIFERAAGVDAIETPQADLSAFGRTG